MNFSGKFAFHHAVTLQQCYDLICTLFANKEIARRSPPGRPTLIAVLETNFFETKVSRLLIEIAAGLRVYDDQMRQLAPQDPVRLAYERRLSQANQFEFGLFDDLGLNLRETCNKIIHSEIFELHVKEGLEVHESDVACLAGMMDKSVDWQHVNGFIRLSGKKGKQPWYVLLDTEAFVSSVCTLLY